LLRCPPASSLGWYTDFSSTSPVAYAVEGISRNAHRPNALYDCMPYIGLAGVGIGSALFHMLRGFYSQMSELTYGTYQKMSLCNFPSKSFAPRPLCGQKGSADSPSVSLTRRRPRNALHDWYRPSQDSHYVHLEGLHSLRRHISDELPPRAILCAFLRGRVNHACHDLRHHDRGRGVKNHEATSECRKPIGPEQSFQSVQSGCR
jgi:hypothetical protein